MKLVRFATILLVATARVIAQAPPAVAPAAPLPPAASPPTAAAPAKPAKPAPPAEVEIPFPADIPIPPATVLSPEEMLKTIKVPPGFHVELVASEPLITTPVATQFDENGRLWVVEMNGYMPNVDAKGEDVPNGRVVVLEDTDGDGKMDKSSVFLDGLVMPRAISLRKGGALVAEPPAVYWCPDENRDLVADKKEPLIPTYTSGGNPEHMPNGLFRALDNWLYNAKSAKRFRFTQSGELKTDTTAFRGQWGIAHDDFGRIYYNTNSDQLRADLLPSAYLARNSNLKGAEGVNVQIAKSQKIFPGRVTPGVNRGYRKGALIDGKLTEFTAVCGPLVYRGDLFPAEFRGNSFVAETSTNLVKRNVHTERDGDIMARDAYQNEEFLTSTSERFRPVNLTDGPDGALYVVDIARGVVQHITYVTPWLRRQILERKLEQPLNQGRVWRVVPDRAPRPARPQLGKATGRELVAALGSSNGWTRDTAQRLLVERADLAVIPLLVDTVRSGPAPLARLHALWTLEGLEKLSATVITMALADSDSKVRAAAVRLLDPLLPSAPPLADHLFALAQDPATDVRLQVLCALGQLKSAPAEEALANVLLPLTENYLARSAALSGLKGRELEFLRGLLANSAWSAESPGRKHIVAQLARCVVEERKAERIQALLDLALKDYAKVEWQRAAVLDGATGVIPVPAPPVGSLAEEQAKIGAKPQGSNGLGRGFKPLKVAGEPPQLALLAVTNQPEIQKRAEKVAALFVWPGKPGYVEEKAPPPLTPAQQQFVDTGRQLYTAICAACHQPNGLGQEGLAPPVANSEWSTGPEGRLIRIVLQGVGGPMTVNGRQYSLEMPGLGAVLNDEQIAQILSFMRRDLGNVAPVVETSAVEKLRAATKDRGAGWTADELDNIH